MELGEIVKQMAKTRGNETETEWRRRLDHRLDNIERLLLHLRDAVVKSADRIRGDDEY